MKYFFNGVKIHQKFNIKKSKELLMELDLQTVL